MCTITWRAAPGLREIYFNRDELKTRAIAEPPSLYRTEDGVKVLAARDPDEGGSWLTVNEYGLVIALLNAYPPNALAVWSPRRSRGLLVNDLSNCHNLIEVSTVLHEENLEYYRPFTLIAFDLDFPEPLWAEWANPQLDLRRQSSEFLPLTSSSYATREVIQARKHRYQEILEKHAGNADAGMLRSFHHDTHAQESAYAVLMDRPDAQTVSYAEIRLEPTLAKYRYQARNPETLELGEVIETSIGVNHGIG